MAQPTIQEVDEIIRDIAANPRKSGRKNLELTFVIIKLLSDNEEGKKATALLVSENTQMKETITTLEARVLKAEENQTSMGAAMDKVQEDTKIIRQDVERRQKEYHLQTFFKEKEETANKIVIKRLPFNEDEDIKKEVSNIFNSMKLAPAECDFEHVRRIPKSTRPRPANADAVAAMDVDARPPLPPLVIVTLKSSSMKAAFFTHLKNLRGTDYSIISCQNEIPRCVRAATAEKEKEAREYRANHAGHRTRIFYVSGKPIIKFKADPRDPSWTPLDL